MYLNSNNNYQENHRCEDCKHINICKWCEDMKSKQEEISKIPVTKGLTPIRIIITCNSFERKIESLSSNHSITLR